MKKKLLAGAAGLVLLCSFAGAASANPLDNQIKTTAPQVFRDPYQPALDCLASQLPEALKQKSIGVAYMIDRTGLQGYSQENASGAFFSQAGDDMLIDALAQTGMTAVDIDPVYRQLVDWTNPKLAQEVQDPRLKAELVQQYMTAHPGASQPPNFFFAPNADLPDIVIQGSFSTASFGNGSVIEGGGFGFGAGHRSYVLRYTLDARAVAMPSVLHQQIGGKILTTVSLQKDVVGYETKVGGAGFFGPITSSTYVNFNWDKEKRELLQYSEKYMLSRTAYGIVVKLADKYLMEQPSVKDAPPPKLISETCAPQLKYGDDLVEGRYKLPS